MATDRFISGSSLNASSFIAGIIEGLLIAAEFPAKVTSMRYDDSQSESGKRVTMFIIKFAQSVI